MIYHDIIRNSRYNAHLSSMSSAVMSIRTLSIAVAIGSVSIVLAAHQDRYDVARQQMNCSNEHNKKNQCDQVVLSHVIIRRSYHYNCLMNVILVQFLDFVTYQNAVLNYVVIYICKTLTQNM